MYARGGSSTVYANFTNLKLVYNNIITLVDNSRGE